MVKYIESISSIFNTSSLHRSAYDASIIDNYGVLYDGKNLYPSAQTALSKITRYTKTIILSNSANSSTMGREKLKKHGITENNYTELITSGDRAKEFISEALDLSLICSDNLTGTVPPDKVEKGDSSVVITPFALEAKQFASMYFRNYKFLLIGHEESFILHYNWSPRFTRSINPSECDFILVASLTHPSVD